MENNEIQRNSYEYWNSRFKMRIRDEIITDDWLDMFSKDINGCNTPIIDLGCGAGNNTVRRHFNIGMNDILILPFLMPKTTHISLHDTLLAVKRQLLVVL